MALTTAWESPGLETPSLGPQPSATGSETQGVFPTPPGIPRRLERDRLQALGQASRTASRPRHLSPGILAVAVQPVPLTSARPAASQASCLSQ